MKYLGLLQVAILGSLVTSSMAGPNVSTVGVSAARIGVPSFHMNVGTPYNATFGVTGLPTGPRALSAPTDLTPANTALIRNDAWAAYNAGLRHVPTAANPNRLAPRQNLIDEQRFVQRPQSAHRYNFQFSDNEVRSVQAALPALDPARDLADAAEQIFDQIGRGQHTLQALRQVEPHYSERFLQPLT